MEPISTTAILASAGINLLGQLLNVGISYWAIKKQEAQMDWANQTAQRQYEQEQATAAKNTAWQQGFAEKQFAFGKKQDFLNRMSVWKNDVMNLVNADQQAKKYLASLYRKAA